ncbi:MAG: hypothetical protein E7600_00420 [Ruminococcaceae bacterium]|nr:hypothetical protein [Oscillospiraceae bacterium]
MKKRIFIAILAIMTLMSISAFAEIAFTVDMAEATEEAEGVYMITFSVTDTNIVYDNALLKEVQGNFRGLQAKFTYDADIFVPYDWEYDDVADINEYPESPFAPVTSGRNKGTILAATYTNAGTMNSVSVDEYYAPSAESKYIYLDNTVVLAFYFQLASGKTEEDFTSESFKIDYLRYLNVENNYYKHPSDSSLNNITLANNVVPEAVVLTIPVTVGDKIYLQDGSVEPAATTGDYEVPATVGYVAVNTGKTAQKTYYVDGTKATLVHENGVLASDKINLRDRTETYGGEDRSGLRFAEMGHNALSRNVSGHEVTEVGVLMTTESDKVLTAIGSADNLTYDMIGTYVKSGYAYGQGYDRFVDSTNDELYLFSAVMYNIPLNEKNVQTNIVCRPYYKVGDTYIYGETMKATLYDIATELLNSEDYEYLSDGQKAYVQEIIACVDTGTDIEDGDIIIDIGGLYPVN